MRVSTRTRPDTVPPTTCFVVRRRLSCSPASNGKTPIPTPETEPLSGGSHGQSGSKESCEIRKTKGETRPVIPLYPTDKKK